MCGIAGLVRYNNRPIEPGMIQGMTNCMSHRGPDAEAFYTDDDIAFGHRRLSIIDLSEAANQPFIDNSGRYIMVFNGEMYNYLEVRPLLKEYAFRTNGDTEVLLAAYIKYGPDCIHLFKGMFAFAIWDKQEKELFVARDRLGVKPLYYYLDKDQFIFASEVRPILSTGAVKRKIDHQALLEFFSYQSVNYPFSIIQNIQQLKAGSWMKIKQGQIQKQVYWNVLKRPVDFDYENDDAVKEKIRELLTKSVERRLIADVPVGAFLSGGIDSSAVVGLMAEVSPARPNTFNISFTEKAFDESKYAELVAKKFNTNHTRIQLRPEIFLDELENGLDAMDIPSGDGINTYVVSKAIRNAGMTVALSGVGGDELFAGYPFFEKYLQLQNKKNWYKGTGWLRKIAASFLTGDESSRKSRIQQVILAPSPAIEYMYPVFRQILSPGIISSISTLHQNGHTITTLEEQLRAEKDDLAKLPLLSQVTAAEYFGYTQNTLLKDTDQMSMAVSLEVREPFFDHDLVEFVLGIPDSIKYPVYPKSLMVESLKPLLPDEIVHREKQGFLFPWSIWMKNELKDFCEKNIQQLAQRDFIHADKLLQYWKRFLNEDKSVRWAEVWLFVVLNYWMEKNNIEA